MTCRPSYYYFFKKKQTIRCLFCSDFNQCGGREIGLNVLLTRNTLETIINLFIASKTPKNDRNQKWTLIQICFFSWTFKEQKYLISTPLIKWNNLTQISLILVGQIGVNDIFLSLLLKFSNISLSSLNQIPKIIKINFYTKIELKKYWEIEIEYFVWLFKLED